MKVAILETIVPSGHEIEYDRGLVNELKAQGHEPVFFVPNNFPFKADYKTEVVNLEGSEAVTYSKAGFFKKIYLSVKREYNRIKWFNSASKLAADNHCDCIIVPTATPRYLRTLLRSKVLCNSKIPVVFNLQVFSFEKKGRLEQFLTLAKKLESYKNIHITITSPNHFLKDLPNVEYINPPFYGPTLITPKGAYDGHEPIVIGLYGYYRKDENTQELLRIFAESNFTTKIKVIMQTVTNNQKDKESCDEIVAKYHDNNRFCFSSDYLFGETWQSAIDNVDIVLSPYSSKQYLYTYSAMCFNALGFKKPVMLSTSVNPQVMELFNVGLTLNFDDKQKLQSDVVSFINSFKQKSPYYLEEINKAADVYSYKNVVLGLLKYCN